MSGLQRRGFHEALPTPTGFEDLPESWQAAILKAERDRPKLRLVSHDDWADPADSHET
jgi:hypothetical protein